MKPTEEIIIALAVVAGLYIFAKTNDAVASNNTAPSTNSGGGTGTGLSVDPTANAVVVAPTASLNYQVGSFSLAAFL
jgi:uncharacterized spore protein YtfJ